MKRPRMWPVRLYRSNSRTIDLDLPALTEILEEDETQGLKAPDPDAVAAAMERLNVIMIRGPRQEALGCSVLYDRGVLADGRPLFEFGSVGAFRIPGYGLLPTMARCFAVQLHRLAEDAVLIGIARMDEKVQNRQSLHQLAKAGFKPIDNELLADVNPIRPIDPGREVVVFDRCSACDQAQQLLASVRAGPIPNRDPDEPTLLPHFDLSPITDGLLEDFLAESCGEFSLKAG
jgi:hypothetical protein